MLLLGAGWALGPQRAQAQCHSHSHCSTYHHSGSTSHHSHSSGPAAPYVPGRWTAYGGLLGLADRAGTPYMGLDVDVDYWVLPRWSTGLRGTVTGLMPADPSPEYYAGVLQPRLEQYSLTWSNNVLLADGPRWRLALQGGAGLGGVGLYDNARGVPVRGSCGCNTAAEMASSTALVTEIGLAAIHKGKGQRGPWFTLRLPAVERRGAVRGRQPIFDLRAEPGNQRARCAAGPKIGPLAILRPPTPRRFRRARSVRGRNRAGPGFVPLQSRGRRGRACWGTAGS